MKFVIQRVNHASVTVDGEVIGKIGKGFMVLIGVCQDDTKEVADKMIHKMTGLRIFMDDQGKTNLALKDVGGELLLVSQFTLYASTVKGNRPSYIKAAKPDVAIPLYEKFLAALEAELGRPVGRGIFGADMKVSLLNDGPVTIIVDSKLKF